MGKQAQPAAGRSVAVVNEILPAVPRPVDQEVCCGPPPAPASSAYERPGYRILTWVRGFVNSAAGPVPRAATRLSVRDILGSVSVRCGLRRNRYAVAPGLYGIGTPGPDSVVLVTANYKLTFDVLRRELSGIDAWILVLDTRGVNVWCAAGKSLFSTDEVVRQVQRTGLERVVCHRRLVLPQLAATGVAARQVQRKSGFEVVWGPVQARDIPNFLEAGLEAAEPMRRVTFTLAERLVLVPVELALALKPSAIILSALFLISGVGSGFFSLQAAWARGLLAAAAYAVGVLGGALAAPVLLPWIPGRAFASKGAWTGAALGAVLSALVWAHLRAAEAAALILLAAAVSSYLGMNFTGATPFTSPSGVEKEMRRAMPFQAAALLAFALIWVVSAFAA